MTDKQFQELRLTLILITLGMFLLVGIEIARANEPEIMQSYSNRFYVSCQLINSSENWWDMYCFDYKDKKLNYELRRYYLVTAFNNDKAINANGSDFSPSDFINKDYGNFRCKRIDNDKYIYKCERD